jgi:hypothetical protein
MSKILTALVASLFALSAFAADAPKTEANAPDLQAPVAAPAPAGKASKKAHKKVRKHKHAKKAKAAVGQ